MSVRAAKRNNSGFTLVEVMVALVVLGVGMLGIAALYIESMRSGQTSVSYTNAVTLAAGMADRIRANRNGGLAYAGFAAANGTGGTAANNCVNGANDCTAAQLAADDWFRWFEDVKQQLPEGRVAMVQVAPDPALNINDYTIRIWWPERGQAAWSNYVLSFTL